MKIYYKCKSFAFRFTMKSRMDSIAACAGGGEEEIADKREEVGIAQPVELRRPIRIGRLLLRSYLASARHAVSGQAAAACSLSIWLAAPMKAFREEAMISLLMATPL